MSVADILKKYGRWMQSRELVKIVMKELKITDRHAYRLIKQKSDSGQILKVSLPSRRVLYGLPEFGPPSESLRAGKEELLREHELKIASALKSLIEGEYHKYRPYALEHLESGYPEIYSLCKQLIKLKRREEAILDEAICFVERMLEDSGLACGPENLKHIAQLCLSIRPLAPEIPNLVKLTSYTTGEGRKLFSISFGEYALREVECEREAYAFAEKVKGLFLSTESIETLRKLGDKKEKCEEKYRLCKSRFDDAAIKLAQALEDGLTNLEGLCELHGWMGNRREIEDILSKVFAIRYIF